MQVFHPFCTAASGILLESDYEFSDLTVEEDPSMQCLYRKSNGDAGWLFVYIRLIGDVL